MAGINKVMLLGNLGKDPEVRHLPSGSSVASFSIATSESYKDKNDQKVEITEWHNVEVWNGLAKVAEQYLKKGMTVFVEGQIRTESWDDKDGVKRYTTKIRALNFQMVGGRPNSEGGSSNYQESPSQQPSAVAAGFQTASADEADDLPF